MQFESLAGGSRSVFHFEPDSFDGGNSIRGGSGGEAIGGGQGGKRKAEERLEYHDVILYRLVYI